MSRLVSRLAQQWFFVGIVAVLPLLGTLLPAGAMQPAVPAPATQPQGNGPVAYALNAAGNSKAYLPLVLKPTGGAPAPTPTATPTPSPGSEGALFLNTASKTNGAKVAIDPNGGIHLTYSAYSADANGKLPASYAYCASGCDSLSHWSIVSFGNLMEKVELALTAAGHPRLLLMARDPNNYEPTYQYAACDTNCASSANNWTITTVVSSAYLELTTWDEAHHSFALDPQDRPRFVYLKAIHGQTRYAFCDATDCTNPASWSEVEISTAIFQDMSLAFTKTGQPRIATVIIPGGSDPVLLYYGGCDSACSNPASWWITPLYDGGGAAFVLRLDSNDRPRLALYQGAPASGTAGVLYYASCNADCAVGENWQAPSVGLPQFEGQTPDLALDTQNRPRIAYKQNLSSGLGYAWCDTNCESESGVWQYGTAEASSALDADWPILPPYNCSSSYWYGGLRSSLALDSSGNPRIGYDGQHLHAGGCTVAEDYRAVRFVMFNQP